MLTRAAAFALLLVASPASAQREAEPRIDCEIHLIEGREHFTVQTTSAFYSHFTELLSQISISAFFYYEAQRTAFEQGGAMAEGVGGSVGFSPPTSSSSKPLYFHIASGERSLQVRRVPRERGFYAATWYNHEEVRPLLEAGGDQMVTFYRKDGEIFDRSFVPVARLLAANDRLRELRAALDAEPRHPEMTCEGEYDEIILVH